jgi:hypothetical protein
MGINVTVHPDEIEFTGESEKSYVRLWRHYCSVNTAKDGGPHLYMLLYNLRSYG